MDLYSHLLSKVVQAIFMIKRQWVIFGICVCLFLMSMFYRVSSAIIAPDLSRDLQLDPQELGLLGAVFFYAFALIQLPMGLFMDRAGARLTMFILNAIGVAGTIIFAQATGLAMGVIGRAMLGLGMSANLMGTFKLLTIWFDLRKFATLSGLVISLGYFGSAVASSPLALMVQALGWRGSFFVLAGINAFVTICLLIFVRDTPSDEQVPNNISRDRASPFSALFSIKTLFLSWNYWAISFSIFFRYGSFAAIHALWAGPFLIEHLGLPAVTAGNLLLMINVGIILGSPTWGWLSDRVLKSRKKILISGLSVASVSTFALAEWQGTSLLLLLGAILFAIGFSNAINHISYAHIRELMPNEMSGTAMTAVNFFTMMGGGLFIHGLGSVIERMTPNLSSGGEAYRTAFLICFGALLMSLALYFTTRDSTVPVKSGKRRG